MWGEGSRGSQHSPPNSSGAAQGSVALLAYWDSQRFSAKLLWVIPLNTEQHLPPLSQGQGAHSCRCVPGFANSFSAMSSVGSAL